MCYSINEIENKGKYPDIFAFLKDRSLYQVDKKDTLLLVYLTECEVNFSGRHSSVLFFSIYIITSLFLFHAIVGSVKVF